MAVISIYGATEMGKSYFADKTLLGEYERSIVFAPQKSFSGDIEIRNPSDDDFLKLFRDFSKRKRFRIVIIPARRADVESLFNRTVAFASALGRVALLEKKRIVFAVDEASTICSPHLKSDDLSFLITQGRHDGVDSVFIAQDPMDIHPSIRRNSTKVISFFVSGASGMEFFIKKFGKTFAEKIEKMQKYHYVTKQQNGLITFTNEKGKIYEKFNEK